jgi:hypothetical protein
VSDTTVDLLDDGYLPDEGEDVGPDLAREPTEVGVRYLMDLGTAELDARHLVAVAKGDVGPDARPSNEGVSKLPR